MRKLISIALCIASASAFAAMPAHMMVPQYGDPIGMRLSSKSGTDAFNIATAFVNDGTATSMTAMVWLKWTPRSTYPVSSQFAPMVMMDVSTEAARATSEGGKSLTNLSPVSETANLPLTNGRWSANCLPSTYEHPDTLTDWQYGCYCFNLTTDSPLTLNVGGEELYVPATNGMVRNIIASTASRNVSIVAESTTANVKFGIAEMPLVQFFGCQHNGQEGGTSTVTSDIGGLSSSEWRLFVMTAVISGGNVTMNMRAYTKEDKMEFEDNATTAMWHTRTTFEKNSRLRVMVASVAGGLTDNNGHDDTIHIYGFKAFRGILSDLMIETIRDMDAVTMQRRGIE